MEKIIIKKPSFFTGEKFGKKLATDKAHKNEKSRKEAQIIILPHLLR